MSSNFDWRAEDDARWDEYASGDPDDKKPKRNGKRPTWLVVSGILVVVVIVGLFAFLRIRRYVENTAASVEEDVLSSHALVKLAAQENDLELFAPLLSGRDPQWTQNQITLLDLDLLLDRRPFGLFWRTQETADDISVTLSPDLQSAEIEYIETYGYGRDGQGGAIQLTQTAVYRLSETRWLLSPPEEDFWGSYITAKGSYVILTYPERDDEIGSRLASDLEAALGGACQNLELNCEDNWPLEVLLSTDPDALIGTGNPTLFAQEEGQLVLPAPTLVGKPANNASYRALYRGYATFLLSRLIARQVGWECCEEALFFKALVDIQLTQLGFQDWPITADNYRDALRRPVELETVRSFWDDELTIAEARERPDAWMLYALVEYLLSLRADEPVFTLQQALTGSQSFNDWISRAGITGSLNQAEQNLGDFIYGRILESQGRPPAAWPEEDIALVCSDGQSGSANVYRYDLAQNRWTVELFDRDFVIMNGLPGNEGLLLTEQFLDVDQLRTTLWRGGEETVINFGRTFYFSTEIHNPAGNYLVLNSFQQDNSGSALFLLDMDNCTELDCPLTPLQGRPDWSPDGRRTLWLDARPETGALFEWPIFMGDEQGQSAEEIGIGGLPFWLDDENFAFLLGSQETRLVKASVDDHTPQPLLSEAELPALIPDYDAELPVAFQNAFAIPAALELIFISAANRVENQDFLFTHNWQTGETKLLQTFENPPGGLLISPLSQSGGRWLTLSTNYFTSSNTNQPQQEIYLYDTERENFRNYIMSDGMFMPSRGWSEDGRWLMFMGDGFITLSAPDADYEHLIDHDFNNCTDATWIE